MWFFTNTWIVLLIKLQALALVTLLTKINYVNEYITSILLLIFWYYLLAPVANLWKQTHLERYVPVKLEQNLFYQMHTLIANLYAWYCSTWKFLLLQVMEVSSGNTKDMLEDLKIMLLQVKSPTLGGWPCGLRHCKWMGRFLI